MNKAGKALALLLAIVFIVGAFSGCKATKPEAVMKPIDGNAYDFNDENGVSVHDPSLFKAEDGTYYVTGSHIASAKRRKRTTGARSPILLSQRLRRL